MSRNDDVLWQRWPEVDRLLNQALDLPPAERAAYLVEHTAGDPELHDLVQRLLARLEGTHRPLGSPAEAIVRGAFSGGADSPSREDLEPGTSVGSYVIVERRGRGGMATVYEAARSDGSFEQRVAIKVLRRGLDTDDLIARFRTERQILSSLTHPNIARLLDGGALADGRPYLVMELVDGSPITSYADANQLTLTARLTLFLDVASAVHAAHRQLVVHRDIKPSNTLVDADGRVTLLDFGIAKLLEGDPAETVPGTRVLTPDYASPEQIRGDPITTGTDIYQLGLLLRELLTGVPPLAGDTAPGEPPTRPSQVATLVVQGPPPPEARAAARGTTPERLAKTLGGDLDILIGKALRPEPNERYASADEFAADVRRYLAGQPIIAHPESTWYKLRMFLQRNRLFLPASIAATVALVGFITVILLQNRRLEIQRDTAETASQRAMATEGFLFDMIRSPDPTAGSGEARSDLTVVDAMQRGRQRLDAEFADQPEVRAAVLMAMGRTFTGLGRYMVADSVLRQAFDLYTSANGASDPATLRVMRAIGYNYQSSREITRADSVFREALHLQTAGAPAPDSTLAVVLGYLSGTTLDLGDADSARALASRAVRVRETIGDTTGHDYLSTLDYLARALRGTEQFDSAEVVYREILRRMEADPATSAYELAHTYNNLGFLLRTRGDLPAAESSYRQAVRLANEALGSGHPTAVMFGNNLLIALELQEKYPEVAEGFRQQNSAVEAQWPNGDWRVGASHLALARFYMRQGEMSAAVAPFAAGVASYVQTLGPEHPWTAAARAQWGVALLESGRVAAGNRELDHARASILGLPNGPDARLRRTIGQLVTALRAGHHNQQADRYAKLLPPS